MAPGHLGCIWSLAESLKMEDRSAKCVCLLFLRSSQPPGKSQLWSAHFSRAASNGTRQLGSCGTGTRQLMGLSSGGCLQSHLPLLLAHTNPKPAKSWTEERVSTHLSPPLPPTTIQPRTRKGFGEGLPEDSDQMQVYSTRGSLPMRWGLEAARRGWSGSSCCTRQTRWGRKNGKLGSRSSGFQLQHVRSEVSNLVHAAAAKWLQSCPILCDPIDGSPPGSPPWDSPGKSTGVGCHCLLQTWYMGSCSSLGSLSSLLCAAASYFKGLFPLLEASGLLMASQIKSTCFPWAIKPQAWLQPTSWSYLPYIHWTQIVGFLSTPLLSKPFTHWLIQIPFFF